MAFTATLYWATSCNSLLFQAPRVTFRLYSNPVKMSRSVKKLHKWIMKELAAQAAKEQDGVSQVLVVNVDNKEYRRQLTAEGGVFIVVVRSPGDWQAVPPIGLAFSFRDLYLLGYQANGAGGIWRLYNDAYLIGTDAENPDNAAYWQYLDFGGGYNEQLKRVLVGMQPMYHALWILNNPASGNIRLALVVYVFVISEAMRFTKWMRYLVSLLRRFGSESLVTPSRRLDTHFTAWSTLCKRIRRGPAAFVPGDGFGTYKELIETVYVLLSRPPFAEL